MHLLNLHAPARPGRRADQKHHCRQKDHEPEQTLPPGDLNILRIFRVFSEKGFQNSGGPASGNNKNNDHQRHQPEQMP